MGLGGNVQASPPVATRNPNDPANLTDSERAIQAAAAQEQERNRTTRRSTILGGSVNASGLRRQGRTVLGG